MEQLLRTENAKLRELVFQHVPDAAKLYLLDHRALQARAASERSPDNEELRVAAEALQNEAAAVSRGRDERNVHHVPPCRHPVMVHRRGHQRLPEPARAPLVRS